jgi:hypothetical protein
MIATGENMGIIPDQMECMRRGMRRPVMGCKTKNREWTSKQIK